MSNPALIPGVPGVAIGSSCIFNKNYVRWLLVCRESLTVICPVAYPPPATAPREAQLNLGGNVYNARRSIMCSSEINAEMRVAIRELAQELNLSEPAFRAHPEVFPESFMSAANRRPTLSNHCREGCGPPISSRS